MITRYTTKVPFKYTMGPTGWEAEMTPDVNGGWVRYQDHKSILNSLSIRVENLITELEKEENQ